MTIKHVFLDKDGTLHFKGSPISGVEDALRRLDAMGISWSVLTNNDSQAPASIKEDLRRDGLDIPAARIFTAGIAALQYMISIAGRSRILCHGLLSSELEAHFASELGERCIEFHPADVETAEIDTLDDTGGVHRIVIVGDSRDQFSYNRVNGAFRQLKRGAELIALQRGRYFHKKEGVFLDTGGVVAMLEYCSGRESTLIGKPTELFFEMAFERFGCRSEETAVVGDDVKTDIAGARRVGARAILVKTGKYAPETHREAEGDPGTRPDDVIESIAALPDLLESDAED